jgi:hypothetical protein
MRLPSEDAVLLHLAVGSQVPFAATLSIGSISGCTPDTGASLLPMPPHSFAIGKTMRLPFHRASAPAFPAPERACLIAR